MTLGAASSLELAHRGAAEGGSEQVVESAEPAETEADRAMARYGAGDTNAFPIVYRAVNPVLSAYLRRHTLDDAGAEDLAQQTFLKMHRHRASFIPGAAVLPWAVAIAVRLFIDRCRHEGRTALLFAQVDSDTLQSPSPDAGPEELLYVAELARRLEREIRDLPELQRTAIETVKGGELSLPDASKKIGTTVTALKLRLFRAYERLRKSSNDCDEGTDE
jgi:RNA polymerase sigma-70 factor (ECF subfamily)